MTADEICKIMDKAKENKIQNFETSDLKLVFYPDKVVFENRPEPQIPLMTDGIPSQKEMEQILKALTPKDDMTEEEILYAATPYGAELIEKRLEEEKKKKEHKDLNEK